MYILHTAVKPSNIARATPMVNVHCALNFSSSEKIFKVIFSPFSLSVDELVHRITSADKALYTFRFQGEMGSILAREANVLSLKLMNPCLLARLK